MNAAKDNKVDLISQDLISAFYNPSVRMACPLCREIGKDSTGDHLQIGERKAYCHSNKEHGTELYGELKRAERNGSAELKPRRPPAKSKPKKVKFVKSLPPGTHYEYHDQSGDVLFVAIRKENPKRFAQYTVVDGGYEIRGYGPGRPLFRLNDIQKQGPVIITEGEKDCLALVAAGCDKSVTTFSQGSGSWHLTDYTPLQDREVWLFADADRPGRQCMRDLGSHLLELGVDVKLYLPDGESGDGAADWFTAENYATEMEKIAKKLGTFESGDPLLPVNVSPLFESSNNVKSFEKLHRDVDNILRYHADDLDKIDHDGLHACLKRAKQGQARHTQIRYWYAWEAGRILLLLKESVGKRHWGDYCEGHKWNRDLAYQWMFIAEVPWEKAKEFKSIDECLKYRRAQKPKKTKASKIKGLEKEIADLKAENKRIVEHPQPQDQRLHSKMEALERRNRELKRELAEKEAACAKLESVIVKTEKENAQLQKTIDNLLESDKQLNVFDVSVAPDINPATEMKSREPGVDIEDLIHPPPEVGAWEQNE